MIRLGEVTVVWLEGTTVAIMCPDCGEIGACELPGFPVPGDVINLAACCYGCSPGRLRTGSWVYGYPLQVVMHDG